MSRFRRRWFVIDAENAEEVNEFLDEHPRFLGEYIDRNPHLLDNYVIDNVDEETIQKWLDKVSGPAPTEVLQILRVNYKKETNCVDHHTDKYIHNSLVVRRAATFDLGLVFKNRNYRPAKDDIVLEFTIGSDPTIKNETKIRVPVGDSLQGSKWTCMKINEDEVTKEVTLQVNIPPDAIIGRYKLTVEVATELKDGRQKERKVKPDIVVLFNPFKPADPVYMESSVEREEYVLNDTGRIYVGQWYRIGAKDWLFGQFEEGILDIALKLLREHTNAQKNATKSLKKRASPAYCSRLLSAMVNCNDDNGVLWGRWDGKYEEGVKPTTWSGSVAILKQWNQTKMNPVKYGQCWVFSGLLTTVLRALGIPARSITNFNSAHDTEYNMTIDKFLTEDGESAEGTGDSIWNFHVWNEGFFRRPDLPKGYDGWQAVDATPQEESSGVMQCGPAPIKAIKNGEIYIGSDTNFVFAEVNADRVFWEVNDEGEVTKMVKNDKRHVGRNISTKAVGSDEREDVTLQYKFAEGSEEERVAFERAYAHGRKAPYHEKFVVEEEGNIKIDINPVGDVINGSDVSISVKVTNAKGVDCDATITTVIHTMLNNEERKRLLKRSRGTRKIAAGKDDVESFKFGFGDYGRHLSDENVIRVTTTVRVKETNKLYVDQYDIQIESPQCLELICADELKVREYQPIRFKITNPLKVAMTSAVFSLQGSGISSGKSFEVPSPIEPGETYTSPEMEVRPYRSSRATTILGDFDCNEIWNIKARKRVSVNF
uniref:protein-glutamine gamma-glutamyltransferase n=1 Tax=Ciona intestinalis TaxID=7719 RepID=F6QUA3_CIOIN